MLDGRQANDGQMPRDRAQASVAPAGLAAHPKADRTPTLGDPPHHGQGRLYGNREAALFCPPRMRRPGRGRGCLALRSPGQKACQTGLSLQRDMTPRQTRRPAPMNRFFFSSRRVHSRHSFVGDPEYPLWSRVGNVGCAPMGSERLWEENLFFFSRSMRFTVVPA